MIEQIAAEIRRPDKSAMAAAARRLDRLTKPPGSLGRLERLVVQLAGMTGEATADVSPAAVIVFAGDHGVTEEGVSAYPSDVTAQMVQNFLAGGAAINALARNAGARVTVVDVGVKTDVDHPDLTQAKVRRGTANMTRGPAMTRTEAEAAIVAGIKAAQTEIARGARCLGLGEMGIGNTTPSAALLAVFSGRSAAEVCGRGTGLDDAGVLRKVAAVEKALACNRPDPADPIAVLAKVGGLEIGALAGAMLAGAAARVPVVIDGFIVGAAALVACAIEPRTASYLVPAHRSAEPGHRLTLDLLELVPLMELDLRLGEGSGAALALPILQAACRVMREMATFEQAGVSGAVDAPADLPSHPPAGISIGQGQAQIAATQSARRAPVDFTPGERAAVYKAIALRRDIRHFLSDPLPDGMVERLLRAAHQAPSVGFMQPWNFVIVTAPQTKRRLAEVVDRERISASIHFQDERRNHYLRLKVEGLTDAPVTICVTSDPTRGGPHVVGRNSDPLHDRDSVSCAIENLWLAARAEGVGVGWVSIFKKPDVRAILNIPPHVEPIGLISIGYTPHFPDAPLLEIVGWEQRRPFAETLFCETWGERPADVSNLVRRI